MRTPGFVPYAATATLARSATEAVSPAVILVALALGGTASTGALLVASLTGAAALAGPVVGALVDRTGHPRRTFTWLLLWMAGMLALLAVAMSAAPLGVLAALAFAAGCSYPAISGAWSAQIPSFVIQPRLPRAYAVDAATYSVAAVVGPPLAAAVLVGGATLPLLIPVVMLLSAVLTIRGVPIGYRHVSRETRRPMLADIRAGLAAMWRSTSLRRTTIVTTLAFGGQAGLVIATPLVSERLTGGLTFSGLILGAFAVGGLIVAVVYTRRPVRRPDLTAIVTTLVAGVALVGVGLFTQPALVLLSAALMGATDAPMLAAMFRVRTREAPEDVRAQVFTTSASLRLVAFAVMSALLGMLVVYGPATITLVGGLVHLLGIALGLALAPWRHQGP